MSIFEVRSYLSKSASVANGPTPPPGLGVPVNGPPPPPYLDNLSIAPEGTNPNGAEPNPEIPMASTLAVGSAAAASTLSINESRIKRD